MYSVKKGSKINAVIFCISSQEYIFIVLKEQGASAFERGIRWYSANFWIILWRVYSPRKKQITFCLFELYVTLEQSWKKTIQDRSLLVAKISDEPALTKKISTLNQSKYLNAFISSVWFCFLCSNEAKNNLIDECVWAHRGICVHGRPSKNGSNYTGRP